MSNVFSATGEAVLENWLGLCDKYDVKAEHRLPFYKDVKLMAKPPVIRSPHDVLDEFYEKMHAYLADAAPGATIPDEMTLMRDHGLDPHVRSDRQAVHKFLRDNEMLQLVPGQPAHFVKRLTNGTGNGAAATNGTTGSDATASSD